MRKVVAPGYANYLHEKTRVPGCRSHMPGYPVARQGFSDGRSRGRRGRYAESSAPGARASRVRMVAWEGGPPGRASQSRELGRLIARTSESERPRRSARIGDGGRAKFAKDLRVTSSGKIAGSETLNEESEYLRGIDSAPQRTRPPDARGPKWKTLI